MTFTFENNNNIIVYTLVKIISYSRDSPYLFVSQCVWWLSVIIGLQQGLVIHINNIESRIEIWKHLPKESDTELATVHPDRTSSIQNRNESINHSEANRSETSEDDIQDSVLKIIRSSRDNQMSKARTLLERFCKLANDYLTWIRSNGSLGRVISPKHKWLILSSWNEK